MEPTITRMVIEAGGSIAVDGSIIFPNQEAFNTFCRSFTKIIFKNCVGLIASTALTLAQGAADDGSEPSDN